MEGCTVCGAPIRYSAFARGKFRDKETGEVTRKKPLQNPGWVHTDTPFKKDHRASPPPGRTPEADLVRQDAAWDQATSHVNRTLQQGFDYLHAQDTVNDVFRDRRAT